MFKRLSFRFASMLMAGVVGMSVAACGDDEPSEGGSNGGSVKPQSNVSVSPDALQIEKMGGSATFSVLAPQDASAQAKAAWLSVAETDKNYDMVDGKRRVKTTFSVTAEPNIDAAAREGVIDIVVSGSSAATVKVTQAGGSTTVSGLTAVQLASKIFTGVNIGNTMEVPGNEAGWGGHKVNAEYVAAIKQAGFNAVRIPCAWYSYIADKANPVIPESWLSRVQEVVNMCLANDLYVLLNSHWDNGWLEDNIFDASKQESIVAMQTAIWSQVAARFADYDQRLMFAACNEPGVNEASRGKSWSDASAVARLIKYEQAMIDAVRAAGGSNADRVLVVQGLGTSIASTNQYMSSLPADPVANRLMVEVHFYEPYQFCLMESDASWGKVFWYWGKNNHVDGSQRNTTSNGEEDMVISQFALMKSKYADQGIPVIIGEYGAEFRTIDESNGIDSQEMHNKSVAYFGEVVSREAKKHGCVPFYWETGSVFSRSNGQVQKQWMIDAIMKGSQEGKYPW